MLRDLSLLGALLCLAVALLARGIWHVFHGRYGRALPSVVLAGVLMLLWLPARPVRLGNEPAVIGDVRAIQRAETGYAEANHGVYGPPKCLVEPVKCGFPSGTKPFLDLAAGPGERLGYRRTFVAGTAVLSQPGQRLAPDSVAS